MINNPNDIGFIHDISNLDKLRQQAVNDKDGGEQKALEAAAKQFESIFTSMLFKSMREAGQEAPQRMPINRSKARETEQRLIESGQLARSDKARFDSPESFITSMRPYAERAAKSLGVEPSLLLAQAALETGWGQKVVKNARGSSNNLFNIKADRSWAGDKVTTQTLEFHDNTPVKETAAFRSYDSFADSFNDYVAFLNNNPRYQTALQHNGDSESFIRGIHRAGYATDPEYADKVLKVQQRIDNM
ncbi:flagellar assembly peptidoglycan hydrolase FlgJ [Vibrio vulnificus]|uniref:flagellar assembly peptidoglycan hydrolase FlgJ n=1 Tax=Vibrio vulnificus TaxID=672 RepID=UPI003241E3E7